MKKGSGEAYPPPPFEKFNHLNLHSKIPLKKDFDPSPPPQKKNPENYPFKKQFLWIRACQQKHKQIVNKTKNYIQFEKLIMRK